MPRFMDASQLNPQNNNARMLLRRWSLHDLRVTTLAYHDPDPELASRNGIRLIRLWRRHAWQVHLSLLYLRDYDVVFYPGVHAADIAGLRWRRRLRFRAPLIATLEGLVGDRNREQFYSDEAGHPVYCQQVAAETLKHCDAVLEMADQVIAISPFLERMGRARYGEKFTVLPVGIDLETFFSHTRPQSPGTPIIVCAGRVASHKRPEMFLTLAERFPGARFRWFGEGDQREELIAVAAAKHLGNVEFPGIRSSQALADEFRKADIFVLPSYSEGVPRVTQEAAACGLPVVLYGYYESPSVAHGHNGFVAWSDEEFVERTGQLIADTDCRRAMGCRGAEMMTSLHWDVVAPSWETRIGEWTRGAC